MILLKVNLDSAKNTAELDTKAKAYLDAKKALDADPTNNGLKTALDTAKKYY